MNLKISHLQHIGIPVTDIKTSAGFYKSIGFKNVMASSFLHNGSNGLVVMMKLKTMIIELYQFPKDDLQEIKDRKNGHIDHIAFDVDDINKSFKKLKAAAYNIVEPEPVFLNFWKKGCKYFNITGPDGERIEFNQIL